MSLVKLRDAKQRLKLPLDITADDADIQSLIDEAEALVLDYVAQRRDDNAAWSATVYAWTSETVPMQVRAGILQMFADLYADRGDNAPALRAQLELGELPRRVTMCLNRLRDPAIA